MKYHLFSIILAVATIFDVNFSAAVAMEERSAFELAESGVVITFVSHAASGNSGGLDPPIVPGLHPYELSAVHRFELMESGRVIDFNPRRSSTKGIIMLRASSSDRIRSSHATGGTPAFEAHEVAESGRLVIFPREVEMRRAQALRMKRQHRAAADQK